MKKRHKDIRQNEGTIKNRQMNERNSDETQFLSGLNEDDLVAEEYLSGETIDIPPKEEKVESNRILSVGKRAHGELEKFLQHLSDATPLISYEKEESEEIMARYTMGAELGRGAIGQVIEAQDEHLKRNVAIKILQENNGLDRDRIARFIAEAQIIAQLEHPTIVPVHEIGLMPGGLPYFTMKKVRGKLLSEVINERRVDNSNDFIRYRKRLLRRFSLLCNGVAYAHSRGVVHRDLKPDNIIIGEYGEIQIMDWGLAKVLNDSSVVKPSEVSTVRNNHSMSTMMGSIAGTPAYMSPEQARGELDRIGPASDIFSLGLLMAEIVTLVRVFRSTEPAITLKQVGKAGPIDASNLNHKIEVPKELCAIIAKCTMPNPEDRYQNAEFLSDDLKAYLENREVTAMQYTYIDRFLKWKNRNSKNTGLIIGAAAALTISALIVIILDFFDII